MTVMTCHRTLILAMLLATTALAGCADVHRNPATRTVTSPTDAPAAPATTAPASGNVPF